MIDERLASVSRNLRAEGYVDNDPDATLAAIRLIALADALALQHTESLVPPGADTDRTPTKVADPAQVTTAESQPHALANGGEQPPSRDGAY